MPIYITKEINIGGIMSISINLNSESQCIKAYINYHCNKNTAGITEQQISDIVTKWSDRIPKWVQDFMNSVDKSEYEFDEYEYDAAYSQGVDTAKDVTGHDGKTGGDTAYAVTNNVANVANLGGAIAGTTSAVGNALGQTLSTTAKGALVSSGKGAVKSLGGKSISKATEEAVKKAAGEGAKEAAQKAGEESAKAATKEAGKQLSAIITAGIAVAVAALYWIVRPNKESYEAVKKMMEEFSTIQSTTAKAGSNLQQTGQGIDEMADEAAAINEETNQTIAEETAEAHQYQVSQKALAHKAQTNGYLSDSEKSLYNNLAGHLEESNETIQGLSASTQDEVGDLYNQIQSELTLYDETAAVVADTQGQIDFAADIDKATQTNCYIEGASQSMNAISGAIAGARLLVGPFWQWIIAGLSFGAAASSGVAAAQQFKWAGDIGKEIDMREMTQGINTKTSDIYDEELENFALNSEIIEGLEILEPEEMPASIGTDINNTPSEEDAKKKKEDK